MNFLMQIFPSGAMSACAGFRAFLPLFLITFLLRSGNLGEDKINPFLRPFLVDNTPIYYALGILAALEILGDKLPGAANFIEIFLMFLRPGIGVVTAFALLNLKDPSLNFIIAVAFGALFILPFQKEKSSARILSESGEMAMYNLTLSFAVDVEAFGGAILAYLVPPVAFFVIPIIYHFTMEGFNRWRVRLIAGQELDMDFDDGAPPGAGFFEEGEMKRLGKQEDEED